ncbi:hypothetical protein QQF64_018990 [Cirrhinus molitorella]|uniref:Ig-like domain-containing protein n=1 Tax=Cirrhinus molitorella TaxID=172907 RepID=A0ABR3LE71_9TELE
MTENLCKSSEDGDLWWAGGLSSSVSFIVCVNLHKVKIMNSRLSPLILMLLIPGFLTLDQLSVTCSQESICAVKGSEVTLKCSYSNINFKTVFWFSEKQSTNWRKNNEPEDLTLDSGRVTQQILRRSSTLTISDVRERDSGEYQLMFIMNGVKYLSSAAVNLTVTVLQVKSIFVSTNPADEKELMCDSSCTLTSGDRYHWMKDRQHFKNTDSPNMLMSIKSDAGSFSCSRDQNLKHPSSSVCLSKSGCWDVTYSSRRVCALVGSTVDISCTYSHPSDHTVNKTFWHYSPSDSQSKDFKYLREEHQFAGRVEYVGNKLRIKDLKISDSGEYRFRIITDFEQYSGSPGVILTVTDPVDSTAFSHYTVTLLVFLPQFLIIAALWMWLSSSVSFIVCVNLHKVKIMNSRLSPLILLLFTPGFVTLDELSVTCSQENICAVKGTDVTLKCSYSNINFNTAFWFSKKQSANWRKNNQPENLTLDSDYSGRVKHQISSSSSTLTISDVRERDSGEYQLMFIMNGVKYLSSPAVNLTVTVLQVKSIFVSTNPADERELICDSSCTLTSGRRYYWMKDGQHLKNTDSPNMFMSIKSDAGSFSCSRDQNLKHPSSSMCLSQSGCWDVTYSSRRVCALVGSTVDISCTYLHPSGHTVNKTLWHYGPSDSQSKDFRDLREDDQFAGRVEYVGNKLRIKDLKISDSGEYRFRIITDFDQYSGSPGVILNVTGTQIKSSPAAASEEEEMILSCSTNCTLNNSHTYIWYKNRRQVTDGFTKVNKLYLDSVSNEELQQYSCAVGDPASSESSTFLMSIVIIILSVLLILTLIGVLWYRRRKNKSSQKHVDTMESEQTGSAVLYDNAAALSTVCTQQVHTKEQDVHYSTVNFKNSHIIDTSSARSAVDSTTDDVHYAAVKFS